jgi:hypothetical protein
MNKNKLVVYSCFLFILGLSVNDVPAQNKNQKNVSLIFCITDSASGSPVELANVILLNSSDSSFSAGGVSSAEGTVTFNNISAGNYFANISFLGYKPETISPIYIPADSPPESGFKVILKPQSIKLSPVTVSAPKEIIVYEENKIVYNASRDSLNFGGSAMEVLENAPMVKIDVDDNISLLGRRTVSIFLNEIPVNRMGISNKDLLKTIHWSEIDRIEIMHNPPQEFDVQDNGGAINIILKKKEDKKYSGYVDASGTTKNEYNSGLGFNYRLNKLNIRSSYSISYSDYNTYTDTYRENMLTEKPVFLLNNNDSRNKNIRNSFRLVLSYIHDSKTSLFQTANYNILNNNNVFSASNKFSDNDNNLVSYYINNRFSRNSTNYFSYSSNFLKTFSSSRHKLTSIFSFSNNLMNLKNELTSSDLLNNPDIFNTSQNYSQNKNNSYSFYLTYRHPVWTESSLNFGYSGDYKTLWLRNNYYDLDGSFYTENLKSKLHQDYEEQNHRFSFGLSGKLGNFNYYLSLELNNQHTNNKNILSSDNFHSSFSQLNPDISLRYKIGNSGMLRTSWSLSERNPLNKELNPYVDYSDSSSITTGNPGLKPEKMEEFTLDYNDFSAGRSFAAAIQYRRAWDEIETYTYLKNEKTAVTTYKNLGKTWEIYLHGNYSQEITRWFSMSLSLSMDKEKFSNNEYNDKKIPYTIFFSPEIRLKNFLLQADVKYSSSYGSFQYSSPESYYVNLGIKTSIFEKRLFLYFKAKDIFNTLNRNSTRYGTGYISSVRTNETSRILSLGLSYYFQETESAEQRVEEELKDDF